MQFSMGFFRHKLKILDPIIEAISVFMMNIKTVRDWPKSFNPNNPVLKITLAVYCKLAIAIRNRTFSELWVYIIVVPMNAHPIIVHRTNSRPICYRLWAFWHMTDSLWLSPGRISDIIVISVKMHSSVMHSTRTSLSKFLTSLYKANAPWCNAARSQGIIISMSSKSRIVHCANSVLHAMSEFVAAFDDAFIGHYTHTILAPFLSQERIYL